MLPSLLAAFSLQWRHNDHDRVSNHQPHGCLLNRLFRRWSKKTSKLRVTGLCAGNSPGTGEFPAQMASYAENVSIWWRHHDLYPNKSHWDVRMGFGCTRIYWPHTYGPSEMDWSLPPRFFYISCKNVAYLRRRVNWFIHIYNKWWATVENCSLLTQLGGKEKNSMSVQINGHNVQKSLHVEPLSIHIDYKLRFQNPISVTCSRTPAR